MNIQVKKTFNGDVKLRVDKLNFHLFKKEALSLLYQLKRLNLKRKVK